jgi:hypothetical protein
LQLPAQQKANSAPMLLHGEGRGIAAASGMLAVLPRARGSTASSCFTFAAETTAVKSLRVLSVPGVGEIPAGIPLPLPDFFDM